MTTAIRLVCHPGEAHVAVILDNKLLDYALWRPGAPDGVGDIQEGRVTAVVPAMAGAFVALPNAEGFLPDTEGAKGLTVGQTLLVRITRSPQGGKGPRLSARLPQKALPGPGPNPVQRFATRYRGAPVFADDPAMAAQLHAEVTREPLDDDVAEAIDALPQPEVTLTSGARLSIWPTPALVAIDIDSGSGLGSSGTARQRHEALNRSLLPALADQIRLRNLSGAILVDVAGMPARKRAALAPDFTAALASDPLHAKLIGFTGLGLAEIVRPRVHPPLHELLAMPLAAGLAALRAVLAATGPDPRSQPVVRAHPDVVSALRADPVALPDMARRTGRTLILRSDPSMPRLAWVLEKDDA